MSYSKSYSTRDESSLLAVTAVKSFDTNYELLKDIMLFQSPTHDTARNKAKAVYLLKMIEEYAGVKGENVKGNLYFTKGEAEFYPTVVAHYDTAQDYHEDMQIIQTKDWIYGFNNYNAKQCGIGADDSVGLYFAVEMLKRLDHCKVVLFYGEERGCVGSNECNMEFFDDSLIVTQLDRRSYTTDFIKYTNGLQVFPEDTYYLIEPLMEAYGYTFSDGSCTDVGALRRRGLKVASHNLSCGYVNEHMDDEVIHINSMENAFCFAEDMLRMISERNIPLYFPVTQYSDLRDIYENQSLPSYFDRIDFARSSHSRVSARESLDENQRYAILENMYGDYEIFSVDIDQLCHYEAYYGIAEDYEKDVISGDLSPELFVALTGKCYNDKTCEVLDLKLDNVKETIMFGVCPVTDQLIVKNPEYYVEHHTIYLNDCNTYIPFQFSPEDCFDLPDDSKDTLADLCQSYYY